MPLIGPGGLGSFNNVPDSIPPIPPGIYLISFTKIEPGDDSAGPRLQLSYKIEGGINGVESPNKNRIGRHTMWLPKQGDSESDVRNTLVNIKQVFTSCGIAPEATGEFNTDKLLGARCNVEVSNTVGKKDGKEYSNVKNFLKTDGSRF